MYTENPPIKDNLILKKKKLLRLFYSHLESTSSNVGKKEAKARLAQLGGK